MFCGYRETVIAMTEDTSYIQEFLEEIAETLERLDRQFVALEKKPSDVDCLTEIFRDLHTIKGSCGLLGLNKLESITHSGENLLGKLRDGELALKPAMVASLLEMMDAVWKTVACLKKEGQEGDVDYSPLIETLALLERGESPNLENDALDQDDSSSPAIDASAIPEFLEEAHEIVNLLNQQIVELENNPGSPDLISSLLRSFHTLKGSSGYMGFKKIETLTHSMENLLITLQEGKTTAETPFFNCLLKMMDTLREILSHLQTDGNEGNPPVDALVAEMASLQGAADIIVAPAEAPEDNRKQTPVVQDDKDDKSESANIRVNVELLDSLMNLVGEVVLARNQFSRIIHDHNDSTIQGTSQSLNRVTTDLQETVMKARMQPIKNVWGKLPRMIRDLSMNCGNKIRLEMEGQDSDLDKSLISAIQDPLMNIIRNAIVHGIESPEERRDLGKPEEGVIRLRAFNQSGQIHIEVQDDGRGVNFQAIKNQAVNEKRITPEKAESLSDKDCGKLLFMSGFSMTENSLLKPAKGTGLTHTRAKIEKIGGTLDIEIQPGMSTTLKIKIPLTLSIIPALIVSSGSNRFAIPQVNIKELIWLEGEQSLQQTEEIAGSQFYRSRGKLLPLVQLSQILKNGNGERRSDLNIVVLQADDTQFGLVVEQIHNTEEIVVKTLENLLKDIEVFSGGTIMGDGEIVLILDVIGLAQNAQVVSGESLPDELIESASISKDKDGEAQDMLIVSLGNDRRASIPLSDVTRLEELKKSDLEISGKESVIQYRGEIMPLIDIPKLFNASNGLSETRDKLEVVVHTHEGKSMGLNVESILDIVQAKTDQKRANQALNLLGTIVTDNAVIDVIDVQTIVRNFLKTGLEK